MHLAGDAPDTGPVTASEPVPTQHLTVTPDNVIQLAVLFRQCATLLTHSTKQAEDASLLDEPWLGDPVSEWAREAFNEYFAKSADVAFVTVLNGLRDQFLAMTEALERAAAQYGLTEELNTALIESRGPA